MGRPLINTHKILSRVCRPRRSVRPAALQVNLWRLELENLVHLQFVLVIEVVKW